MSNHLSKHVWLVGSGFMALEYAKVLAAFNITTTIIGRGEASAQIFTGQTGLDVTTGGIDSFLENKPKKPDAVIIAVNVVNLAKTATSILGYCQPKILLEKPGAITTAEVSSLETCPGSENVYIAYNRRFFASTQAVRKMLAEDGGATSCTFEFTEWGHRIDEIKDQKDPLELAHWLIANSSHAIDLAFNLSGYPKEITSTVRGSLPWHPSGSAFAGAGVTDKDATFSYHANWNAPGRWWVEVMSPARRFRMCPIETVQVQNKGSVTWDDVDIDLSHEKKFKPGLYSMVETFLEETPSPELCTFNQLSQHFSTLQKIAGYKD
jgi:predicted dehydrogenase